MIVGTILLGGCANGDFGRVRPSLVSDDMHAWIGDEAVGGIGGPASEYSLTDEERQLRDLAYPLIEPAYDRGRWFSVFGEYGALRASQRDGASFDRSAYWAQLNTTFRRSQESSYAQLITDARNDVTRIEPFFSTARRVIDMDRRRALSLDHVSELSSSERSSALARNNENIAIIRWVCRSLDRRVASYRFALERLVIAAPSPTAAETDRSVNLLRMRTDQACGPARKTIARAGIG